MTAGSAKTLVRVVGTLAGLYGIFMLFGCALLLWPLREGEWRMLLLVALPLLLGMQCLYVGYLVWWRFSPLAVRHVCGTVGCVLFLAFIAALGRVFIHPAQLSPLWAFALPGGLVWIHFLYRVVSERLSRLLFPFSLSSEGQT